MVCRVVVSREEEEEEDCKNYKIGITKLNSAQLQFGMFLGS